MSTVPQVRNEIRDHPTLDWETKMRWIHGLTRQTPKRKAPRIRVSREAVREDVKRLAAISEHTQVDIARLVGLRNPGRVSEILNS